jgi:hypothetical protein
MTDDEVKALLDGATPGPWRYRPHKYDDWGVVRGGVFNDERGGYPHLAQVCDPDKLDDDTLNQHRVSGQDPWEGNARLTAAAPDLARALLEARTENARLRADAQAAVAAALDAVPEGVWVAAMLAAEEADNRLKWFTHWGGSATSWQNDPELRGRYADAVKELPDFKALISAVIAPVDGLAELEALRKERDDARAERDELDFLLHEGGEDSVANLIADRDRLAADLAAAQAQIEALRGRVLRHRNLDAEWHRMWRSGRDPGEEAEAALQAAYDAVTAALPANEGDA